MLLTTPPIQEIYWNRCAHLFLHSSLSPAQVKWLTAATFMDWARHYAEVATAVDHEYARRMLGGLITKFDQGSLKADVRYIAALRCAVLWRVYSECDGVHEEAALPYMVGTLLDCHLPLIATLETTVRVVRPYELYSTPKIVELSPDSAHVPMHTDEQPVPSCEALEWIWKMRPQIKCGAEMLDFLKLMAKGSPRPVSIRYIMSSIRKQLQISPPNKYILRLLCTALTGGWRHSTSIADPIFRFQFALSSKTDAILRVAGELLSKELYCIVAEALYAYTRHHSPLLRVLSDEAGWENYLKKIKCADTMVRPILYRQKQSSRSRSATIQISYECLSSVADKWDALVQALGGCNKAKIPQKILGELGDQVSSVYGHLKLAPAHHMLHRPTLLSIGISATALGAFEDNMVSIPRDRLQRVVNKVVSSMAQRDRCLLYIYIHFVIYRNQLAIFPINTPVRHTAKALEASDRSTAMVCRGCFTIRTQNRGKFQRKSREGLLFDTLTNELFCSSCHSRQVEPVDTKHNLIFGYSINALTTRFPYSACCVCGETTLVSKIIGTQPVCAQCHTSCTQQLQPFRCLCGKDLPQNAKRLVVQDGEAFQLVGLCASHAASVQGLLGHHPSTVPKRSLIRRIIKL